MGSATNAFLEAGKAEKTPGARRAKPKTELEAALLEARRRAGDGEWNGAKAPAFVGLYALCHVLTYGVEPAELAAGGEWRAASRAALNLLHTFFLDDGNEFASFIRWTWQREKGRLEWLHGQGREVNRIGWRLQFSLQKATDYRVAAAQNEKRGRSRL